MINYLKNTSVSMELTSLTFYGEFKQLFSVQVPKVVIQSHFLPVSTLKLIINILISSESVLLLGNILFLQFLIN